MIYANTYDEMRNAIQDGDVVFFRKSGSLMGKLIRWLTVSPYEHVAIAFWLTSASNKRLMLVEAQGGTNRRIINASFYADRDADVLKAPKPWAEIEDEVLSNLGIVKYSYSDAAMAGIKDILAKRIGIKVGIRPNSDQMDEICSQLVHGVLNCSDDLITPGELFHCMVELGAEMRVTLRQKERRREGA